MKLSDLFYQREKLNQKRLLKYTKLAFSDTFVLGFMIIFGGLSYAYSQYLRTIPAGSVVPSLIFILFISIIINSGKLITALEEADKVFIIAKEKQFIGLMEASRLKQGLRQSIAPILISLVAMPTFVASGFLRFWHFFLLVVILFALKLVYTRMSYRRMFQNTRVNYLLETVLGGMTAFVIIGTFVFWNVWIGLLLAIITSGIMYQVLSIPNHQLVDWDFAVEMENKRKQGTYRFFNLFTDIPFIENRPKRLKFLDPFLSLSNPNQALEYYLQRLFIRDTAYSGLVFRLVLVASVILVLSADLVLFLVVQGLFSYLISFQLLPVVKYLQKHHVIQSTPMATENFTKAVKGVIRKVMNGVGALFVLVAFVHSIQIGIAALVLQLMFNWFVLPLVVNRFSKQKKNK